MIVVLNAISILVLLCSVVILILNHYKREKKNVTIMVFAFLMLIFTSITNLLEHPNITSSLDKYENYFQILFIPVLIFAMVSIKDNGVGIHKNMMGKHFDPFFTTRPVGKVMGMGLSIVYEIINKHGGKISVNSIEGKGSEFIVEIPV